MTALYKMLPHRLLPQFENSAIWLSGLSRSAPAALGGRSHKACPRHNPNLAEHMHQPEKLARRALPLETSRPVILAAICTTTEIRCAVR